MSEFQTPPRRLWKYRGWNEHTQRLVLDGEVYFATMKELNDPFEFRWRERYPLNAREIEDLAKEMCARRFPDDQTPAERFAHYAPIKASIEKIAAESRDGTAITQTLVRFGVFCLSELYNDILMWSHYATMHRGVCVGIRCDSLHDRSIYPVIYSEAIPVIEAREYLDFSMDTFNKMALSKATHWAYEKEWRRGHPAGACRFPKCVDAIIIGAMMPEDQRNEVREAVAKADFQIEVYEARLSERRYRLEVPGLD